MFPQIIYLNRICQNKSEDTAGELSAPKRRHTAPPGRLQLSGATEAFMGVEVPTLCSRALGNATP